MGEGGWGCWGVVRAVFKIITTSSGPAPPLTSKIMKSVLIESSEWFRRVLSSRAPYKPVFVSNLMFEVREGVWRPLYARPGRPVFLREDAEYRAVISSCTSWEAAKDLINLGGRFKAYGFGLTIEPVEARVTRLSALRVDAGPGYLVRLEFLTPTIVSVKHMAPPMTASARRAPNAYRLVPQPSVIFAYLLRLWNHIARPGDRLPNPAASDLTAYVFGRASDLLLTEIDYRIRPETAIIGKDNNGKIREVRGFTGWVTYQLSRRASKKYINTLSKLLALAQTLGVGRSRGIGFGHTTVQTKPTDKT